MGKDFRKDDDRYEKNGEKSRNAGKGSRGSQRNGSSRNGRASSSGDRGDAVCGANGGRPINDPSWYHLNDVANKAAGNLPFGMTMGQRRVIKCECTRQGTAITTMPTFVVTPEGSTEHYFDYTPGMMLIWYTPTVGVSEDGNSAINVATQGSYSWIRHANSGRTNYDPSDLMMYFCAVDSLQTLYAWMCKLYGNISRYSAVNRYLPQDWFDSLGIDFADFQNNIPNFLAYLNMYALKLATFAVPDRFPIFKRHAMLASTMFVDMNLAKDKFQIYDFNPRHIWKYAGLNAEANRTELQCVVMPNADVNKKHPMTFAELTAFADSLINPLISNVDDFGTMSGDVRKAYKDEGLFTVKQISSDYRSDLIYDEMILQQIQNMDLIGEIDTSKTFIYAPATDDVILTQYALKVQGNPAAETVYYTWENKSLLTDRSDPGPDDVFEITRNVAFVKPHHDGGSHVDYMLVDVAGTEVFENAALVYEPNSSSKFMVTKYAPILLENEYGLDQVKAICAHNSMLAILGAFAYRPEFHVVIFTKGPGMMMAATPDNRDLVNWTTMSAAEFKQINDVAMMSLWDVPRLGTSF